MKETAWLCDFCGQNVGIDCEETVDRNLFRNRLINGQGRIDVVLHGDPTINPDDPRTQHVLVVKLESRGGGTMNRDVCKDCLLQGLDRLEIGMPERNEK